MAYRTQDLIFTLYGDYLVPRGGETWTGHIIQLMAQFDVSPQAVRSTLSRMSRNGWLVSRKEGRHSFYAATSKTESLVTEGARRIYQPRRDPWDGLWHIITYTIPEDQRHIRHRLRQRLTWLGFGRLAPATWISPRHPGEEIMSMAEQLKITGQITLFSKATLGFTQAQDLVNQCWDLATLNQAYLEFINRYRPQWRAFVEQNGIQACPQSHFVKRFLLVHDYRSFPYVDPNLPPELLPNEWLGDEAITLFQTYAALLNPGASQYVQDILSVAPHG